MRGAEGERLQPDAVIFLPEDRQLIVDAKVSNKAWTAYCGEKNEDSRASLLRDHLASIRAHMKGLAGRDYPGSPDLTTVDFVLMFVPVEAALLTALAAGRSRCTPTPIGRGSSLVSPSTLMAVVKLVEGMWTFQQRQESAEEIAEAGRKLYEKLRGLRRHLHRSLGTALRALERRRSTRRSGSCTPAAAAPSSLAREDDRRSA